MSANERIDKFYIDCHDLITSKKKSKIISEIVKIGQWMVKHQDESVSAGCQTKLLQLIENYLKYISTIIDNEEAKEKIKSTIEILLALPEGKLVNTKIKKRALQLLQILTKDDGKVMIENTDDSISNVYIVIDINVKEKIITLVKEGDESVVEDISLTKDEKLFSTINNMYETEEKDIKVNVDVESKTIIQIHTS